MPFQNREPGDPRSRRNMPIAEQKSCLLGGRAATRRRRRSELRSHPKEEAMSHALATVLRPEVWQAVKNEPALFLWWRSCNTVQG